MKVKMILPALTEATSPFFRPIKYSLFPPLGLATLAASACLNVVNGFLFLGRWQRVFLVELDGPRDRELSIVVVGESSQ